MAQAYTDQGDLPRALGAYRAATRLQPDNPQSWRALAIFLGPDTQATGAWRRVHRLDPQDPEAAIRARLGPRGGGGLGALGGDGRRGGRRAAGGRGGAAAGPGTRPPTRSRRSSSTCRGRAR